MMAQHMRHSNLEYRDKLIRVGVNNPGAGLRVFVKPYTSRSATEKNFQLYLHTELTIWKIGTASLFCSHLFIYVILFMVLLLVIFSVMPY